MSRFFWFCVFSVSLLLVVATACLYVIFPVGIGALVKAIGIVLAAGAALIAVERKLVP